MNRRDYIKKLALLSAGLSLESRASYAFSNMGTTFHLFRKAKTILLCTGVQYANIGDVGHVTGILSLLNTHLPEAKIILWPKINIGEFDELIRYYWPDVQIIHSRLVQSNDGIGPNNPEIYRAIEAADFFIGGHGETEVMTWLTNKSKKPYGIIGVTVESPPTGGYKKLIDGAKFFFSRESSSLANVKKAEVNCPILDFAPDATFGSTIADDRKGEQYLRKCGLERKKFICVVPRLRVTPYYRIDVNYRHQRDAWSEEKIRAVDALNSAHQEKDHAKAREAIVSWVRRTGLPVLLCPEMIHNMDLYDELLYSALPADVKEKVVKRNSFWAADEAAMVYRNATLVISFECHSPILAMAQGTPGFYLRQPEDTIKGQMYNDIGVSHWMFDIESTNGKEITSRLLETYDHYDDARKQVELAMDYVRSVQRITMAKIRRAVGLET